MSVRVWSGVAAFTVMGLATAPFITATFAARNRYAPTQARGQVFVTLAALKITATSGGTALAGLLVGREPAFGRQELREILAALDGEQPVR